jgi:hypothetical protein
MEKDVKIGNVGDVDFVLADGKASVKLSIAKSFDQVGIKVTESLAIEMDEKVLLDKLVAALPAGFLKTAAQMAEDLVLKAQASAAPAAPAV